MKSFTKGKLDRLLSYVLSLEPVIHAGGHYSYTVRTAEIRQKKGVNRRVESFFLSEKNQGVESLLSETRQNSVS